MLETSIKLGGREINLKPSHKAIFAIEKETGLAVFDLLIDHQLKAVEICSILYHCAVAAGEKIHQDEIGELLIGKLSAEINLKCNELLGACYGFGEEKKKEEEAPSQQEPTS
jgi:hypothetical protein